MSKVLQTLCYIFISINITNACAYSDQSNANHRYWSQYHQGKPTPKTLEGKELVLQVEHLNSLTPDVYPSQGAIVQRYAKHTVEFIGLGDDGHTQGKTTYKYRKMGGNSAVEKYIDPNTGQGIKTIYAFHTRQSGTWERTIGNSETTISGHFTLVKTDLSPDAHLAPENHNGKTVVLSVLSAKSELVPVGNFPSPGTVILQSYSEGGSYIGEGYGPGTVDHLGEFNYEKISANSSLEQTVQTIPEVNYTDTYTMLYTYETPISGRWYQNFGNGLIIFSGTFTVFESQ